MSSQSSMLRSALTDLVAEFVQVRDEFDRLKRTYEPPYVGYASWSLPAALAALEENR